MIAAQTIHLGHNDVVVVGGMESMSNAPKYIVEARFCPFSFMNFLYYALKSSDKIC
jgi:acetyl-CoA C-acetyltransferase